MVAYISVCMIPVCHHIVILFVQFYFCLVTAVLCPCPFIWMSMKLNCSSLNYIFFQQIFNVTIQRQILNVLHFIYIFWHRIIEAIQQWKPKQLILTLYMKILALVCFCVHILFKEYIFNHESLSWISQLMSY